MYYYAIIDTETGICHTIEYSDTPLDYEGWIEIDSLDRNYLIRKKYVNGQWEDTTVAEAIAFQSCIEGRHIGLNGEWLDLILAEMQNNIANIELTPGPAGAAGSDGADGQDGADGVTFTPAVSSAGVLSWTNNGGLANPASVNIKGPQGDPGSDATVTAAGVLELLKTVDGSGSGVDADLLDGKHASEFATANHTHNNNVIVEQASSPYARLKLADSNLETRIYKNASATADYGTTIADYDANGARDTLILCRNNALENKAYLSIQNDDSTRSVYYLYGEHHKPTAAEVGALPATGGTVNGDVNVAGVLRAQSQQAVYFSGSQMIYGTNNYPTRIAGSAITATKTITVDSDERLKDVREIDKERLINFMKQIKFVEYSLKDDEEKAPHFGVLAQQLISIDAEIARYFVSMGEDGFYSVDYTALALLAMLALQ